MHGTCSLLTGIVLGLACGMLHLGLVADMSRPFTKARLMHYVYDASSSASQTAQFQDVIPFPHLMSSTLMRRQHSQSVTPINGCSLFRAQRRISSFFERYTSLGSPGTVSPDLYVTVPNEDCGAGAQRNRRTSSLPQNRFSDSGVNTPECIWEHFGEVSPHEPAASEPSCLQQRIYS